MHNEVNWTGRDVINHLKNGLEGDVITSCVGRITGGGEEGNDVLVNTSTLAWMYTGDVGVKEKHKRENSLYIIVNGQSSIQIVKLIQNKKTKKRFDYTIVRNGNRKKKTMKNTVINGI
jgi:hypothetical protein